MPQQAVLPSACQLVQAGARQQSHLLPRRALLAAGPAAILLAEPPALARDDQGSQARAERGRQPPQPTVKERVREVLELDRAAKDAARQRSFAEALALHTRIAREYSDLALSVYARISRCLLLYETDATSQAILELDNLITELPGYPEVNAALAALLYKERPTPAQRQRAEALWEASQEFDTRYKDVRWVETQRGWPPRMLAALQAFLTLQ